MFSWVRGPCRRLQARSSGSSGAPCSAPQGPLTVCVHGSGPSGPFGPGQRISSYCRRRCPCLPDSGRRAATPRGGHASGTRCPQAPGRVLGFTSMPPFSHLLSRSHWRDWGWSGYVLLALAELVAPQQCTGLDEAARFTNGLNALLMPWLRDGSTGRLKAGRRGPCSLDDLCSGAWLPTGVAVPVRHDGSMWTA